MLRHEARDLLTDADTPPLDVALPESVDWEGFRDKHPQVQGTAEEWLDLVTGA
ncbi:hypothetical protein [Streptomyces sp. HUAS ZL42]|uniref:hypothetical protein n=1 Tax=Streptomyces sp. HUAS ZL42 TaxID=3231715 RepID=UPI00345E8B2B